jgi:hypothetical protein
MASVGAALEPEEGDAPVWRWVGAGPHRPCGPNEDGPAWDRKKGRWLVMEWAEKSFGPKLKTVNFGLHK